MPDASYDSPFTVQLKVRDYECDMQGIVNNANYQHYLEHARHEFLLSKGLSFAELTRQGVIIVVARAELDYRAPLKAGDECRITVSASKPSPIRLVFAQQILRVPDDKLMVSATIITTAVNERNRPWFPETLNVLLGESCV